MRGVPALLLVTWLTAGTAAALPPEHAGGRGSTVLLVTGPEADEGLYRLDKRRGLAPFLARRGFSVWIADGDELADAVDAVLEATGEDGLSLVGHGLGGTACYRYLTQRGPDAPVDRLVTLGAPFSWSDRSPLLDEVIAALGEGEVARYSQLARRDSAVAGGDLFGAALTSLAADRRPALLEAAREGGAMVRHPALDDLSGWIADSGQLPRIDLPALMLCGELDRIAPCEEAARARDALGSGGRLGKLGYMNLDPLDFGHLDLVLTPEARRRVFPLVVRFLHGRGRP